MIKGSDFPDISAFNGHNARTYSGIQYAYVAPIRYEVDFIEFVKVFNVVKNQGRDSIDYFTSDKANPLSLLQLGEREDSGKPSKGFKPIIDLVWLPIPIDCKKSKFASKSQGEHGGKTYENTLNLYVRGASHDTVVFLHSLLNYRFAVIFTDANGNYRLMFDPVYNNELDIEQDSGEGLAADAGFSITITNQSILPALFVASDFRIGQKANLYLGLKSKNAAPEGLEIEIDDFLEKTFSNTNINKINDSLES